jgi:hypothetical protein
MVTGKIECVFCGAGMSIKPDKNGHPFGHCRDCGGQLRVGKRQDRIDRFLKRHNLSNSVTVTESVKVSEPVTVTESVKVAEPVRVTVGGLADVLKMMAGVKNG